MTRVKICVDLPDQEYRLFAAEAKRRGVTPESLVEECVAGLIRELDQEERDGTDHPIVLS
jgi:hypothetical protein